LVAHLHHVGHRKTRRRTCLFPPFLSYFRFIFHVEHIALFSRAQDNLSNIMPDKH